MQKVSFSFPADLIQEIDESRGDLSRNQFVLRLLIRGLKQYREQDLYRITAEVYGDSTFAGGEEQLAESFFELAPEADL